MQHLFDMENRILRPGGKLESTRKKTETTGRSFFYKIGSQPEGFEKDRKRRSQSCKGQVNNLTAHVSVRFHDWPLTSGGNYIKGARFPVGNYKVTIQGADF